MSEELTTLVQVLELYGKGVGALGRAIKFTAKGAKTGVDFAKLKNMQRKMKLHYASEGKHNTMKVKDLEELTGGNYKILNIPLEDEKGLIGFYDCLKKLKVSFAELPDLCIGDGYTQIAYDPQNAEKVKLAVEHYRKRLAHEPMEITLEDYEKLGGEDGKKILDDLASKGYKAEKSAEQIAKLQARNKDQTFAPITLNFESLLLEEYKDRYYFRIPKTMNRDKSAMAICVRKEDVLIIDDGKTAFTHLKNGSKMSVYQVNAAGVIDKEHPEVLDTDRISSKFNKVDIKELWQVNHIKVNETGKLPNFNKGQEIDSSALPDSKVKDMIHLEEIKAKQGKKEYIPLELDVSESLVAEDETKYLTKLPDIDDLADDNYHCLIIEKSDAILSNDGNVLMAYLHKDKESAVKEIARDGTILKTNKMKNENVVAYYIKAEKQRSKGAKKDLAKNLLSFAKGEKPIIPKGRK